MEFSYIGLRHLEKIEVLACVVSSYLFALIRSGTLGFAESAQYYSTMGDHLARTQLPNSKLG